MGEFRSELHVLCAGGHWTRLRAVLADLEAFGGPATPPERPNVDDGSEHLTCPTTEPSSTSHDDGGAPDRELPGKGPMDSFHGSEDRCSSDDDDSDDDDDINNNDDDARPRFPPAAAAALRRREGDRRQTPLSLAVTRASPPPAPDVVTLLVRACPGACRIPDRDGQLPLAALAGRWGRGGGPAELDPPERELCSVVKILVAAHPEALAATDRWGRTPLHALFDNDGEEEARKGTPAQLPCGVAEALLGLWDDGGDNGEDDGDSDSDDGGNDRRFRHASAGDARRRALRARDAAGRLPLHCAAACPRAGHDVLRRLVAAFPPAAYIPAAPPVWFVGSSSGTMHLCRGGSNGDAGDRPKGEAWGDVARDAAGPAAAVQGATEFDDDDDEEEALFPQSYRGADLAVHLLHRRFLSLVSLSDDKTLWPRHGRRRGHASILGDVDESSVLNRNNCNAVSALLEPLVAATRGDGARAAAARRAAAATGSHVDLDRATAATNGRWAAHRAAYGATLLPLHVAALHGVPFPLLDGLCHAFPPGAGTLGWPSPRPSAAAAASPLTLYEEGRAGREVHGCGEERFPALSREYFECSDLLFSWCPGSPGIEGRKAAGGVDGARLARFEERIRAEANAGEGILSDEAARVWRFLCCSRE